MLSFLSAMLHATFLLKGELAQPRKSKPQKQRFGIWDATATTVENILWVHDFSNVFLKP